MLYQKYALTQSLALKILEAVTNKAKEFGIKINAAIVDEGANLKAVQEFTLSVQFMKNS